MYLYFQIVFYVQYHSVEYLLIVMMFSEQVVIGEHYESIDFKIFQPSLGSVLSPKRRFLCPTSLAYGQSHVSTRLNLPLCLLHRTIEFCFDILYMYHMYMYMHVRVLSGPLSVLNWLPWCDIPSLINTAGLTLNNPNIPYTCATST